MIAALALLAAALPSAASAELPAATGVAASLADDDLREFAAVVGRETAGQPVGGPYRNPDKLLILRRNDRGETVVAASFAFPVRQSLPAPPPGTLAIIRLHQRSETVVPGPTADDLAFVATNRIPLFVVGEWVRPALMWEVVWIDGAVRYRTIGEVGEIGPWQD